jgi:hypothetical protein
VMIFCCILVTVQGRVTNSLTTFCIFLYATYASSLLVIRAGPSGHSV